MATELTARGVAPGIVKEVAEIVRREYGGGQAYIRRVDREGRDQRIEELLDRGVSPRAIARATGLHPATIRRKRSGWL